MPLRVPDVHPQRVHALVVVEQRAVELGRVVGLEPGGFPGDIGVDGRVGLAVGIGGEAQDLVPDGLGGPALDPRLLGPAMDEVHVLGLHARGGDLLRDLGPEPVRLRHGVAGDLDRDPHDVLLVEHHAVGVAEQLFDLGVQVRERFAVDVPLDELVLHAARGRTGTNQR